MGEHVIKLPDIGEGIAEAELVEWLVEIGQEVREDEALAAVMTDKATVEIPSPVTGKVLWLGPGIGDSVAVGSAIIKLEIDGDGNVKPGHDSDLSVSVPVEARSGSEQSPHKAAEHVQAARPERDPSVAVSSTSGTGVSPPVRIREAGEKPLAPPSVRMRALERGIDLRRVPGSGPAGRISHDDLDGYISHPEASATHIGRTPDTSVEEIKVVGLRRKISEKMSIAKSRIPHITYIEEVDVTLVESLRQSLNASRKASQEKLTLLPFLMRAMLIAIREMPQMNGRFDDDAGIVHRYGGVHFGIATQIDAGLVVPVIRHAEAMDIREIAAELVRVTSAARKGTAKREELSGSTITITSLGALGGLATTPVINYPELAIVGVNKMRTAPIWDGHNFVPRQVMNLSSSFDHRIIDGWDAALFVQRIKSLLETPALIFMQEGANHV